ncbi:hypothetical protein ACFVAJ_18755 [Agromyces sp. NPDC057679]|uniref:hypothetical protein n=1 Tax=Agromyces sp. NPDC057679 TaxID=3346207 RepID=UPI00366A5B12
MNSFDESLHPRGHHTNPGRFSEKQLSSAEVSLTATPATPVTARVGKYELRLDYLPELPEWPATLPEPVVEWDYDDDGEPMLTITSGADSFWISGDENDGPHCSLYDLHYTDDADCPDWSAVDRALASSWAKVALVRTSSLVSNYETNAAQEKTVYAKLLNLATGGTSKVDVDLELNDALTARYEASSRIQAAAAKKLAGQVLRAVPDGATLHAYPTELGYDPVSITDGNGDVIVQIDEDGNATRDGDVVDGLYNLEALTSLLADARSETGPVGGADLCKVTLAGMTVNLVAAAAIEL